nr:MAG: hypothetical protein [Bacteriophage sp.]
MEGVEHRGTVVGYGATAVEVPEGSPFSLADLTVLAYLIENGEPGGWARFDYGRAEDDLWDARCGGRSMLRTRLRLLAGHGLIEKKTVGVRGENGVRTLYRVNAGALGPIEVFPAVRRYRVLQC